MSGPLDVGAAVERIQVLSADLAERSGGRTRLLPVTKALPVAAVEAVRRAGTTPRNSSPSTGILSVEEPGTSPGT